MSNIIGIVLCAIAIYAIMNPYKAKFYYERICMFIGFCPRCKKFSVNRIKDYSVCSGCGKR